MYLNFLMSASATFSSSTFSLAAISWTIWSVIPGKLSFM